MIKKLRSKFIILSMIAVVILLAAIIFGMNVINYNSVIREADDILEFLCENGGVFPGMGRPDDMDPNGPAVGNENADDINIEDRDIFDDEKWRKYPKDMSPEVPYESRFFSIILDENNDFISSDMERIKAVGEEEAIRYAMIVASAGKEKGFLSNYRFYVNKENGNKRITFLDLGRKLDSFKNFMQASIIMAACGCILFLIVIVLFSRRIVRPVEEAYEKQKRFVSDAGHEIKTPLTIIKADADILGMDLGDNEWLADINKQTDRLSSLTNDLIYLSKTEEGTDPMKMIEFPISDVVEEMAESFNTLSKSHNKKYEINIEPMISYKGDEKAIGQLVSILLDNAFKYSPDGKRVSVTLLRQGKNILLSVFNDTENEITKEQLSLLFDRFYRIDASRNSKTGGYGIGLSIAKAIVSAHDGKIQAKCENEKSLTIEVLL